MGLIPLLLTYLGLRHPCTRTARTPYTQPPPLHTPIVCVSPLPAPSPALVLFRAKAC